MFLVLFFFPFIFQHFPLPLSGFRRGGLVPITLFYTEMLKRCVNLFMFTLTAQL